MCIRDSYYPYVEGDGITTQEQIEIEKHSEKESYAGVCDEMKLGVTLILDVYKRQVHGRAEELSKRKDYRESFDLCVSRAVANLSTLSEYCLPFILSLIHI